MTDEQFAKQQADYRKAYQEAWDRQHPKEEQEAFRQVRLEVIAANHWWKSLTSESYEGKTMDLLELYRADKKYQTNN